VHGQTEFWLETAFTWDPQRRGRVTQVAQYRDGEGWRTVYPVQ